MSRDLHEQLKVTKINNVTLQYKFYDVHITKILIIFNRVREKY